LSSVTVNGVAPGPSRARRWLLEFRERETRWAYLFILPWIFGFVTLTFGPMLFSAYYSFTNYGLQQIAGLDATKTVGLDNYSRFLHDGRAHLALENTFVYTLMMVPARIVLALLLALVLMRVGERLGGIFRTIFYIPHITPPVAVGVLVLTLFNGGFGVVNKALSHIGITGPYWTIEPSWLKPTIAIMDIWACGGTMVILLAALYGVPRHLYEAAAMDGASKLRQFFNITLPMISPALFFCLIILTLAGLNQFAVAYTAFFGSAGGVGSTGSNDAALLYAIYLFKEAFQSFEMGYASALAWVLFAISLAITAVNVLVSRRFVFYQGGQR